VKMHVAVYTFGLSNLWIIDTQLVYQDVGEICCMLSILCRLVGKPVLSNLL